MNHYATQKSLSDAVDGGGLLVVAQWEAKPGEADKIAAILDRFAGGPARGRRQAVLDLARKGQSGPVPVLRTVPRRGGIQGAPGGAHFKTWIAGEALPLLAKRERAQYGLL